VGEAESCIGCIHALRALSASTYISRHHILSSLTSGLPPVHGISTLRNETHALDLMLLSKTYRNSAPNQTRSFLFSIETQWESDSRSASRHKTQPVH
jgi:hypothetical protein